MTDRVTANLPARNLKATAKFYARLGFVPVFQDEGWMILRRGSLEIEFFPHSQVDPRTTIAGCCIRVADVDALHAAFAKAELPLQDIPRLTPPVNQPWGFREFALVDLDGNLLRCLSPHRTATSF